MCVGSSVWPMRLFRISSSFLNQATKRAASAIIVFSVFALLLLLLADPLLLTISMLGISALVGFWAIYAGHRFRKEAVAFDKGYGEIVRQLENGMNNFLRELSVIDNTDERSQRMLSMLQNLKTFYDGLESDVKSIREDPKVVEAMQNYAADPEVQLFIKIDRYTKLVEGMLASEAAEHSDRLQ
jgi:hypothetical protein